MSNDQNLVFRVAGQGPTWNVLNGEGDIGHSVILGSTRRGKSALLQAEAYRLGISYEELERRMNRPPNRRRSHE